MRPSEIIKEAYRDGVRTAAQLATYLNKRNR